MKKLSLLLITAVIFTTMTLSCNQRQAHQVKKDLFGLTPEGDSVFSYTFGNDIGMKLTVLNYGGIIQSWMAPDKTGKLGDMVLGFDSLSKYISQSPYFGALIGRYGNRIAKGTFTLNDSTYHLFLNDGPNSLHGGKTGFDKKIWDVTPFDTDTTSGVKLHYLSKDGEEGYPGNLDVNVTYTLDNNNELRIDYQATTDKPTVLNLTNHSYFNLRGGKDSINDYLLMIDADHFLPVDSTLIPTGELQPVAGTPMDFLTPTPIGKRIHDNFKQLKLAHGGYDHCWVLNTNGNLNKVAVSVYDPQTGRMLQVYTTEPGIQFYSGNFLDGSITGKNEITYPKHSALALETEHFPDSPNQPSFPSTVLKPGDTFHSTTIYKFSVKKE